MTGFYKDDVLAKLSENHNIAQFVSFDADMNIRFVRLRTKPTRGNSVDTVENCIRALLRCSLAQSVNIRTFYPFSAQGNEFIYGLKTLEAVMEQLWRLAGKGLYMIVHETIDKDDGGVSGVSINGVMEFAPGMTVRGIEDMPDPVCALPEEIGKTMLSIVYGLQPDDIPSTKGGRRTEFSVHPEALGIMGQKIIIWEDQTVPYSKISTRYVWPTAFSKMIGDKAFGLLLAYCFKFPVPETVVHLREKLNPFTFGEPRRSAEVWTRTCPAEPVPGKYPTECGLHDPQLMMVVADPDNECLVSCLVQEEIPAKWSGAVVSSVDGAKLEGVRGFGDKFMQGSEAPQRVPEEVGIDALFLHLAISKIFGSVKIEWAHDGECAWLLQVNQLVEIPGGNVIYPGEPSFWFQFLPSEGLEALRSIISKVGENQGIMVKGCVGMSSHVADVLRKAKIPSRISDR